ncbi:AI-2E family transporter [Bulleidia sp. zg-1006]|uniref:AI-2E family transporter n=1 Tax=Bulleidia sp. zg-1006 TaxID=2806552 RepID=UPI0019395FBB|nr:AI-2E family transporter [Bulleidia sp. zg-1006]QRG87273.1 AI-2E family transporter [Bulleidia sp. zg-1006]
MKFKNNPVNQSILLIFILAILLLKMDWIFQSLVHFLSAFHSLLIGAVLAYLVNIVYSFLRKKKIGKGLALGLAYVLILLVMVALLFVMIPELYNSIGALVKNLPSAIQSLGENEQLKKYAPLVVEQIQKVNWQNYIENIVKFVQTNVLNLASGTLSVVNSLVTILSDGLIALIFSIYLLVNKDYLKSEIAKIVHHFLKPDWISKLKYAYGILHRNCRNFIVGQLMEAFILSTLCALGMLLFRFPYALSVGILVGFINIIPIIGAYIGGAIGVFMVFTVKPILALFFIIYLLILQQIESNFIYPKVVGARIGLPAIWVFTTVVIMGSLFGIMGMLVGIPLASTAYQVLQEELKKEPVE